MLLKIATLLLCAATVFAPTLSQAADQFLGFARVHAAADHLQGGAMAGAAWAGFESSVAVKTAPTARSRPFGFMGTPGRSRASGGAAAAEAFVEGEGLVAGRGVDDVGHANSE